VGIPALEAVRMLRGELAAGAGRHADHQRHRHLAAGHVRDGGGVVQDLVEGEQAEVAGHDLDDGPQPGQRRTDAGADETVLGQRRVDDALGTELLQQPLADGVAAAVLADVLVYRGTSAAVSLFNGGTLITIPDGTGDRVEVAAVITGAMDLAIGDRLQFKITQIGTTTAGQRGTFGLYTGPLASTLQGLQAQ